MLQPKPPKDPERLYRKVVPVPGCRRYISGQSLLSITLSGVRQRGAETRDCLRGHWGRGARAAIAATCARTGSAVRCGRSARCSAAGGGAIEAAGDNGHRMAMPPRFTPAALTRQRRCARHSDDVGRDGTGALTVSASRNDPFGAARRRPTTPQVFLFGVRRRLTRFRLRG